LEHLVDSEEEG
jgi:hypothetical protein